MTWSLKTPPVAWLGEKYKVEGSVSTEADGAVWRRRLDDHMKGHAPYKPHKVSVVRVTVWWGFGGRAKSEGPAEVLVLKCSCSKQKWLQLFWTKSFGYWDQEDYIVAMIWGSGNSKATQQLPRAAPESEHHSHCHLTPTQFSSKFRAWLNASDSWNPHYLLNHRCERAWENVLALFSHLSIQEGALGQRSDEPVSCICATWYSWVP